MSDADTVAQFQVPDNPLTEAEESGYANTR